jgi:hypothetical protein
MIIAYTLSHEMSENRLRFPLNLSQGAAAHIIDGASRHFRGYRQADWSTGQSSRMQ